VSGAAASRQAAFLDELQARTEARRADGHGLALLLVDCGVIGRIDGVWGYAIGDAARERFAARLRADVVRPQDLFAELGRDEFACALDAVDSSGIALLAAQKVLRTLDAPVWAGDDEIYPRATVGIALLPEHGDNAATLLQHAKAACRAAGERPERIAVFAEADERPEAELLRSESRLRAAVTQERLALLLQPRIEFRTGLLGGAECLLGLGPDDADPVPVHAAITAAEGAGRIEEATRWLLNTVLRHCSEIRQGAGIDLRMGISLSVHSLRQPDLPDFVAGTLKVWNLRPSRLTLGMIEARAVARSPEAATMLKRLKEVGVRLAIDDPRTGYATLARLAALPFDELRLDLTALRDLQQSPRQLAVARSVIELAHQLRLEVLADGVGDEAMAAQLKELGCDYMQGAHVGPALDPERFVAAYGQA
jgi:diguanylate cyclase (GGDEF)-like protein